MDSPQKPSHSTAQEQWHTRHSSCNKPLEHSTLLCSEPRAEAGSLRLIVERFRPFITRVSPCAAFLSVSLRRPPTEFGIDECLNVAIEHALRIRRHLGCS